LIPIPARVAALAVAALLTLVVSPATAVAHTPPPQPIQEWPAIAAHYSPGVFAKAARRHGLPPFDGCHITTPWHHDPSDLGKVVDVRSETNGAVLACRISDFSADKDHARHLRNRLVEIDFTSATVLCEITRVAEKPARMCPVTVMEMPETAS
jgi:hypothetical protein